MAVYSRPIEEFLENWETKIAVGKKETTLKTYGNTLHNFELWLAKKGSGNFDNVTQFRLREYFKEMRTDGKADATIQKYHTIVKAFLKHRGEDHLIEGVKVRSPRKIEHRSPKSLTKSQTKELLDRFEQVSKNTNEKAKRGKMKSGAEPYKKSFYRDRAILTLFLYCGLRVFELQKLNLVKATYDCLEFSQGRNKGIIKVLGKRDIYREIPFDKTVASALTAYLDTRNDDNPALFLSNFNKRISIRNIQDVVAKAGLLIGIEGLGCHQLRHTFGYLYAKKRSINELAELMGHSDPRITMIYAKPHIEKIGEAIDDLLDGED